MAFLYVIVRAALWVQCIFSPGGPLTVFCQWRIWGVCKRAALVQNMMLNGGAWVGPRFGGISFAWAWSWMHLYFCRESWEEDAAHGASHWKATSDSRDYQDQVGQLQAELSEGLMPCSPSASETTEFSQVIPCSRDIINTVGRGLSSVLL